MPENLAVLDPGEFFGEMALVENKLRSATATAVGQSEVYALEQTALDGFFAEHPDIHLTIVQNLVHITSSRLRFSDETLVQSAYDCIIEIDASFHVLNHSRITTRPRLIDHTTDDANIVGHLLFEVVPRLGEGDRSTLGLEYEDEVGEIGFYEVTVAPGNGPDDPIHAALGIRNVTKMKALEIRLIQTEKLAMMGQMAAEIGHELRNYLTVLIGHVDLLGVNPDIKKLDKATRSLGIMGEQLERIEKFATGLMELGVLKLTKEPSNLNLLVEKLIDFIRGQKRFRRVEFESQLDLGLPEMEADHRQIHQVLMNLYANAADAMDVAGEIKTRTRTEKDGFGLAVCRRIIENHQGEIYVESVVGQGTTFRLEFNL